MLGSRCLVSPSKKGRPLVRIVLTGLRHRRRPRRYMEAALEFKRLNCRELVPTDRLSCVRTFTRLLDAVACADNGLTPELPAEQLRARLEPWFQFCLVWGLGGPLDEAGRKKFDGFMKEMDSRLPGAETLFEHFVDPKAGSWASWESKLSGSFRPPADVPVFRVSSCCCPWL